METLTGSWKKHVDFNYLCGEDFMEKPIELTVKAVIKDQAFNVKTNKDENVVVLKFEETTKGIILNLTNSRSITRMLKTDIVDKWIGKKIMFWGKPDKRHGHVIRVKEDYSKITV